MMFSFEGHYKKQRTINYSKEKEIGKKDLIEKAKAEREKRALNNHQIVCATIIQKAYRKYTVKKIKKINAFHDYQNQIKTLYNNNNSISEPRFLPVVLKITDILLCFYNGSNVEDSSLKVLIERLIKGNTVRDMIAHQPTHNYYNAVTLCLLVRVTARHMSFIDENASPAQYNLFLRFLEQLFVSCHKKDTKQKHLNFFHKAFLEILLPSNYFRHMSTFILKQLIRATDSVDSYKQTKINSVLKIVLMPMEHSQQFDMLNSAVIHYINNIFSSSHKHNQSNTLSHLKLMSIALLDIVPWHVVVNVIFKNYLFTDIGNKVLPSVGLIYLLLGINPATDGQPSITAIRGASQIVILFFNLSKTLINSNVLFLSNNIAGEPHTDVSVGGRDNYDFDMKETHYESQEEESDDDDDDIIDKDAQMKPLITESREMSLLEHEIALILRSKFSFVVLPMAILDDNSPLEDESLLIDAIGYVYNLLVLKTKIIGSLEAKTFILNLIQTSRTISRRLWHGAHDQRSRDMNKSVMDALVRWEFRFNDDEIDLFFGKLLCFANCLHWRLLSVQDLDLVNISSDRSSDVLEFSTDDLCTVVLKLRDIMCGLIFLIYPSSTPLSKLSSPIFTEKLTKIFIELQRVVIRLYNRDVRKGLKMSGKRLEWVKPDACRVNVNNLANFRFLLLQDFKFGHITANQMKTSDLRQFVILKEMPFIVPIGTRMKIFKQIINALESPSAAAYIDRTSVRIRRDHIYEDAFSQITKNNLPNIRSHLKIEFIDRFGIDEAGIDGGGLLREFLSSIVMEACDPKRGLFVSTTNNLLYPNPEIETLYPDDWQQHLFFVGRMLGLVVSKGLLVEVPFAPFFLQRLFGSKAVTEETDIDNLQYLDEDLYRNLLSLKSMAAVEDIHLDFTLSRSCYGATRTVDLKPGGANIVVTNGNKIEYIYLVADYKLRRQIAAQTAVLVTGVEDVLPVECLHLFDLDELSFMISGGDGAAIDVEDLRRNTLYHGLEDPDQSETIRFFWEVVRQMTEDEKRSFVQFVTSLSRAPMLGFGELSPKFAIVIVPDRERLPTASTCLNLLKLPAYTDQEEMRRRLLYAIGADTGFHLS